MNEYYKIKRNYKLMDKVIEALNIWHNKQDHNEKYKRNKDLFEKLKKLEILHPNITAAFREEETCLLLALEEAETAYLAETNRTRKAIILGEWWRLVLGGPCKVFLTTGEYSIKYREYEESYTYYESDGYGVTRDCTSIILRDSNE